MHHATFNIMTTCDALYPPHGTTQHTTDLEPVFMD